MSHLASLLVSLAVNVSRVSDNLPAVPVLAEPDPLNPLRKPVSKSPNKKRARESTMNQCCMLMIPSVAVSRTLAAAGD